MNSTYSKILFYSAIEKRNELLIKIAEKLGTGEEVHIEVNEDKDKKMKRLKKTKK